MILSQTKIFNIFPLSIQLSNILKVLTKNCDRGMINYIPARDLWIPRLYFSLSNESKYPCLIIDCWKSGPAKYRAKVDNKFEKFKKDRLFNKFLAKRVEVNNNSLDFKNGSVIMQRKTVKQKFIEQFKELKHLANWSDGNNRGSDRQQIAE